MSKEVDDSGEDTSGEYSSVSCSSTTQSINVSMGQVEGQLNQLQTEILDQGNKIGQFIQHHSKNHKPTATFRALVMLFELFKSELEMNLKIRQSLMKQKEENHSYIEQITSMKTMIDNFFKHVSNDIGFDISDFNGICDIIKKQKEEVRSANLKPKTTKLEFKLKKDNEILQNRVQELEQTLDENDAQFSLEMAKHTAQIETLKKTNNKYTEQLKGLENQNYELEHQINELEQKFNQSEESYVDLKNKYDKSKESNKDLKKQNNELQDALKKIKDEAQDKNKQAKSIIKEQTEKIEELKKYEEVLPILKDKIQKYKQERKIMSELQKNTKIIPQLQEKVKKYKTEKKALSEQLDEQKQLQENAVATIEKLRNKLQTIESTHDRVVADLESKSQSNSRSIQSKMKSMQIQIDSFQKVSFENKRLESQLRSASKDLLKLEEENARLRTIIERLRNEIRELRADSNMPSDEEFSVPSPIRVTCKDYTMNDKQMSSMSLSYEDSIDDTSSGDCMRPILIASQVCKQVSNDPIPVFPVNQKKCSISNQNVGITNINDEIANLQKEIMSLQADICINV